MRLILNTSKPCWPTEETRPGGFIALGRKVLETEAQAITALKARLDQGFTHACELILACSGRVIVIGMGKSGHIGNKVAATLASTGTPAFFVHPAEASHGDLGMITDKDLVLALSNSGETEEILTILPLIKRLQVPLIALTGRPESTLATVATVHLDVSVAEEACPLGLAPTASTTATLAMGDALAVALLDARGFTSSDFARSHPGGRLGRRLLLHIADIMHTGERIPCNHAHDPLPEALVEMSSKALGMTVIVNAEQHVLGVFTDGDLRRTFERHQYVHTLHVGELMTTPCQTVSPDLLAAEAVALMETHKILALPVVDSEQKLIGAFNMHDLFKAGVV